MSDESKEETWGPFRIVTHNVPDTNGLLVLVANSNYRLGQTIFNEDGTFEIKLDPSAEQRIITIDFGE